MMCLPFQSKNNRRLPPARFRKCGRGLPERRMVRPTPAAPSMSRNDRPLQSSDPPRPCRHPLQPPGFVDDSFEQASDRPIVAAVPGSSARRARELQPRGSAGRCSSARRFFYPTDFQRAARRALERSATNCSSSSSMRFRKRLDERLQAALQPLHVLARVSRTRRRTRCVRSLSTNALPTTAASAARQASATCSGLEIPKPTAIGKR